jgi:drug/metabolite transporter (DMT)-like permease
MKNNGGQPMATANGLALLTVTVYSLMHVIAKSQIQVKPLLFIGISMGLVALFAIATALATDGPAAFTGLSLSLVGWLCVYAIVNLAGFLLYLAVIGKMPIMQYQVIALTGPIIGGLLAFTLLREPLSTNLFLSLPFFGIGIYIALAK